MATQLVCFEIPGKDTGRARTFYGELLGWSFDCLHHEQPQEIPGVGRYAACRDDQGPAFSLCQPVASQDA